MHQTEILELKDAMNKMKNEIESFKKGLIKQKN